MTGYKLSRTAIREVADIVGYLHREAGSTVADKIEKRLFKSFADLAEGRALGHRRDDLTNRNVLFYFTGAYAVIFRKTKQTIFVAHVAHSSQDLKRLLN